MTRQLTTRFWDNYFQYYDVLNQVIPYQDVLEAICRRVKGLPEKSLILDLGSGTGNLSLRLQDRFTVVSLDNNGSAQARHRHKDTRARLIHHDINTALPFADNAFDVIVSNNTLYLIAEHNRPGVMAELHRVLRPGGLIVLANVGQWFSPLQIYRHHFQAACSRDGFLPTLVKAVRLMPATISMFYYNARIKQNDRSADIKFFSLDGQAWLLKTAGFGNVSPSALVYAGQAIINQGVKPEDSHETTACR